VSGSTAAVTANQQQAMLAKQALPHHAKSRKAAADAADSKPFLAIVKMRSFLQARTIGSISHLNI
jgi:hypothetical protein